MLRKKKWKQHQQSSLVYHFVNENTFNPDAVLLYLQYVIQLQLITVHPSSCNRNRWMSFPFKLLIIKCVLLQPCICWKVRIGFALGFSVRTQLSGDSCSGIFRPV